MASSQICTWVTHSIFYYAVRLDMSSVGGMNVKRFYLCLGELRKDASPSD